MNRETFKATIAALKAEQVRLQGVMVDAQGKPAIAETDEHPAIESVPARLSLLEKAAREYAALADAIVAVQATYSELGIRSQ